MTGGDKAGPTDGVPLRGWEKTGCPAFQGTWSHAPMGLIGGVDVAPGTLRGTPSQG
jgi:hypothetical protein